MNGGSQLKPAVDLVYGHNGVRGNCVCLLNKTRQIGEGGETIWMQLMSLFHVIVNICWFKLAERFILVRFAINEKLRPFLNHTRFFKLTGQATPSFLQNIVTFVRMSSSKYIYCWFQPLAYFRSEVYKRDSFYKRICFGADDVFYCVGHWHHT